MKDKVVQEIDKAIKECGRIRDAMAETEIALRNIRAGLSGIQIELVAAPAQETKAMFTIGTDHKLQGVAYQQAADHGGTIKPEAVVIHYSAGASKESDLHTLTAKDDRYVSAHMVIGRDGKVTQLLPLNVRAFHAGASEWQGRKDLNSWSIGIELTNWGPLVKKGGVWCCWPGDFTRALPTGLQVFEGRHSNPACQYQGWEAFPAAQLEAAEAVVIAIARQYAIDLIVGHDDVSPGRKIDPGPAYPMAQLRAAVAALKA